MWVCLKCGATYPKSQEHCGLDGERLSRAREFPLVGRTIDRYRIDAVLGLGGMACVYRATHLKLDQSYAFKALHGPMASDAQLGRRFQREAKVLSRLSHPHIVQVTDFGATEHGLLYMVMEYLAGEPLWEHVRREGAMAPHRAARVLLQVCAALDRAHRKGFVHRDLKPQNLMLLPPEEEGDEETVKVLDFGLVGMLEPDAHAHTQLTAQGMFMGTPAYMAPEQVTGGAIGPQVDLYALGVVAYWMLTAETPFSGDARELAHQHVTAPAPRPRLEYGGLTPIVLKLLEKDPARRYGSARELAQAIQNLGLLERLSGRPTARSEEETRAGGPDAWLFETADQAPELSAEPALVVQETANSFPPQTPRSKRSPTWPGILALVALLGVLYVFRRPVVQFIYGPAESAPELMKLKAVADGPGPEPKDSAPPESAPSASPTRGRPSSGVQGPGSENGPSDRAPAERVQTQPAPSGPSGSPSPPTSPSGIEGDLSPGAFRVAYREADQELTEHLSKWGVAWSAVQERAPEAAAQWGRWYRGRQRASRTDLKAALEALKLAARQAAQSEDPEGRLDRSLEKILEDS